MSARLRALQREGLESLLAPATSYSFDQFGTRVQDLLLAVLFLEGITAPLAVIQRPLRAFRGIARPTPERPKSKPFRTRDSLGCAPLVYRLRRCLQGITLVLIGIGLARDMALCCRSRWKKSGHASRSVLRTG